MSTYYTRRADWIPWAVRAALILLFLGFSYWALRYSLTKYTALGYSGEFCYYTEMATSLLDPDLGLTYSFNPFGHNAFGYAGYEGTDNFFHSIHFEPIKYLYTLVYGLSEKISFLFLFISLLYFSPLLYLAWAAPIKERAQQFMAVLWGLLYVLYPPTMEVVSFDLRPRTFLVPAVVILLIAVLYKRPLWEKVLALLFLISAREEAILITPFIILIDWLGVQPGKSPRKSALTLVSLWLAGAATAFVFFEWGEFEQRGRIFLSLANYWFWVIIAVLLGAGLLLLAIKYYRSHTDQPQSRWPLQLAAYLPVIALVGGSSLLAYLNAYDQATLSGLLKYLSSEFLYTARLSVLFSVLFGLVGLLWLGIKPAHRRFGNLILLTLVLVSAAGLFTIYPQVNETYGKTLDRVLYPEHAAEIMQLRTETDIYNTIVLYDTHTMTAFCDYEHGYALERSPYYLVQDKEKLNYPDNLETLKSLLTGKIELIAIHRTNQQTVDDLLSELDITPLQIQVSEYGKRYLIYWLR
jgi:hypothetical protein